MIVFKHQSFRSINDEKKLLNQINSNRNPQSKLSDYDFHAMLHYIQHNSNDYMVKTTQDARTFTAVAQTKTWPISHHLYGSGCMDDRHAQDFRAHINGKTYSLPRVVRPKMAGGSLGTVSAMQLAVSNLNIQTTIESVMNAACDRITSNKEAVGLHTGPNLDKEQGTIDCKALDSFAEIISSIQSIKDKSVVYEFCQRMLGADFNDKYYSAACSALIGQSNTHPRLFQNYSGSVALRLSLGSSNIESSVLGNHDGVIIMIADTPEFAIDQVRIRQAANNNAGVFAINVAKIHEYAARLYPESDTALLLHVAAIYHAATIDLLGGLMLPVERLSIER